MESALKVVRTPVYGGRRQFWQFQSSQAIRTAGPKLMPFFKTVAIYFVLLPDAASVWATVVKCAPILSLMFFVVLHGVGFNDEYVYSRRVLTGLGLSCLGDALLVWPNQFLTGMGAFGLAQVAYIDAFKFRPLRPALGAVIYAFSMFAVWQLMPGTHGVLRAGVPIYSFLLATMVWRAVSRVHFSSEWTWTELCSCAGGISFALSDGLIGFNDFHSPIANVQVLIMSTYYLAQLGMALSVVSSRQRDLKKEELLRASSARKSKLSISAAQE